MTRSLFTAVCAIASLSLGGCSCQPSLNNNNKDKDDPTTTDSPPPVIDSGPAPPCAVPEIEPNNSVGEATPLPLEQLGCGVIDAPGDIDVFATEIDEQGWISVETAARSIGSAANLQVVVTPPTGSAAVRADDEGTVDASLRFPAEIGPMTVQLSEQNFNGGETYFYEVAVSSAKAPVEWDAAEVEPNDALATAMPVEAGDRVFGDMYSNLDGDWYRIDVPPGKHTVVAEITAFSAGSAGDFQIFLSDPQSNLLPMGCNPATTCATRGDPIDPALHDPLLEWESTGNEQLFVKVGEEDFHWGAHTWYVIHFDLVGSP